MGEVEAATVEQLQELEQQMAALAEQHAADIADLQHDINQLVGAIGDMTDRICLKIDSLNVQLGNFHDSVTEALLVFAQNDGEMFEVLVYILGILIVFVIALLGRGVYKFIRIFF